MSDEDVAYTEPDDAPRGWVERNPGLRGFVFEVQTSPGAPFVPVKCNSRRTIGLANEFFEGRMLFMLARGRRGFHRAEPPVVLVDVEEAPGGPTRGVRASPVVDVEAKPSRMSASD